MPFLLSDLFSVKYGLLFAGLQWGSLAWRTWTMPAPDRLQARGLRPASDLYWFLPVLGWGLDAVIQFEKSFYGHHGASPFNVLYWMTLSASEFASLLASSFVAERVARRAGLPTRTAQATVPLPVLAAIGSASLVWILAVFLTIPLPPEHSGIMVRGSVVDDSGKPIAAAHVELRPVKGTSPEPGSDLSEWTDERGAYAFKWVPQGTYIVSVLGGRAPTESLPFIGTYYPGVDSEDVAREVDVAVAGDIELPPVRLRRVPT